MADREGAERLLHHPVAVALSADEHGVMVAASIAGDPPCTRLAWIDWRAGAIVGRLVCPPGRPSRLRPLVATDVRVTQAGVDDRVVATRVASGVDAVRIVVADAAQPDGVDVGPEGIALVRLPGNLMVVAIDAVHDGEAVGRLDAAGIATMSLAGGQISGRRGAGHGLAAGFGAGFWVDAPEDASFEAGIVPRLPSWLPDGLAQGRFHVEPDLAYPSAPPSVAVAWGNEPGRILLRQMAGYPASPDPGGTRTTDVPVGAGSGVLTTRGRFATLVWEVDDRSFGLQVSGFDDPGDVAVRVARSV